MAIGRTHLKRYYFRVLELLGRDDRLLRNIAEEDRLVILNLHRVSPDSNPYWDPLHPDLFDELLAFVTQRFHVTTFAEHASLDRSRPALILSFDDGYHDFVEYAMPVLDKHGLRANQNVVPECVRSGNPGWNLRLYDFLRSVPRSVVDEIRPPGFEHRLEGDTPRAKTRYGTALSNFLKLRPRAERETLLAPLAELMDRHGPFPTTRMMDADDVRQAAAVHEIGVHSFSHESMGFESDDFFAGDLDRCFAFFADELSLPLTIYAFPNGSYRAAQVDVLRERGIEHVLLVDEDYAQRGGPVYPRFTMYGDTGPEVRLRALGFRPGRGS